MHKHLAFCLVCLIGLTASAQTINLRGVVSNSAGKPVANAIITLVKQGLTEYLVDAFHVFPEEN